MSWTKVTNTESEWVREDDEIYLAFEDGSHFMTEDLEIFLMVKIDNIDWEEKATQSTSYTEKADQNSSWTEETNITTTWT